MNIQTILLVTATAFALVACPATPPQPDPPTPPPTGDTTAPSVVSVSPENASNGVAANAKIRIEFSEPMNQAATEAAFLSGDMPSVTFTWSPNGLKLEIDPVGDLEHTALGRVYSFRVRNTATDLAGNALSELASTFRTLREVTQTFKSVAELDGQIHSDGIVNLNSGFILVGDSGNNTQQKGFLSFDLTNLETNGLTTPERITSAKMQVFQTPALAGSPYTDLKIGERQLLAAHVDYGATLNFGDFNLAILHDLGEISSNTANEYKVANALESVRDDWRERVVREHRSQFMLFFPLPTDADFHVDQIVLKSREALTDTPELEIKFLVP